jgi:hypothetical protein
MPSAMWLRQELPVQIMRTPGIMAYRLDLIQVKFSQIGLIEIWPRNLADILNVTVRCDESIKMITCDRLLFSC